MMAVDTLDRVRTILTERNRPPYRMAATGPLTAGAEVRCLRPNGSGYYLPTLAHVVRVTQSGRVTVDLYEDRSERVTVTTKALLWPDTSEGGNHA
jgi:hypothetical protein